MHYFKGAREHRPHPPLGASHVYTSMHGIAKKIMDNNVHVVSDKLKVSYSLTSGGTFCCLHCTSNVF